MLKLQKKINFIEGIMTNLVKEIDDNILDVLYSFNETISDVDKIKLIYKNGNEFSIYVAGNSLNVLAVSVLTAMRI